MLFAPSGQEVCTIHQGVPVFVEGFTNVITNLDAPFSSDPAVQLRVARDGDYATTRWANIAVDGGLRVDVRSPRFEVASEQRSVLLPAHNVLGVEPQVVTLTAHGWMATVRHLPPGLHHIVITHAFDFGDGLEVEVNDQAVLVTTGS